MKRKLFMTVCSLAAAAALTVCGTAAVQAEEPQNGNTASIITDDGPAATVSDQNDIRGGTNQNDAFLLPLETKLYGTVQDGELQWFAFTTDSTENATYALTAINKSTGTNDIVPALYDESGNRLGYWGANESGAANTYWTDQLSPNTTYYLAVCAYDRRQDTIHYMLRLRNTTALSDAYQTAGNVNDAVGANAALEGSLTVGSNMDDAGYIPMGAKIGGTVTNGAISWLAFTTDDTENAVYTFTTVNESVGTNDLVTAIYDEYGNRLNYWGANENGVAATNTTDQLSPNTTYYLDICAYDRRKDTINYTLLITPPEKPEDNTATVTMNEEPLVFEEPFELNETQVMFVVNQAEFIDETAAKEALKPVADAILAHPEASILIAGTTATDGTQESCVSLSNERAEAVKNLLVSAFGVPESQIQTIGLGYADDPFVRGADRIPEGDVNGQFVESEGAKNRRVVVMDAESEIAKQILGQ